MIVARLKGGLGNQMFQYAMGYRMAHDRKTDFRTEISRLSVAGSRPYAIGDFRIEAQPLTAEQATSILRSSCLVEERQFYFDPDILQSPADCVFDGYWQSEKYFAPVATLIREQFALLAPMSAPRAAIADRINACNAVSVHVRRGDYLASATLAYHGICEAEWYERAMTELATVVTAPQFFIFNDDPDWARTHLPTHWPIHFMDPQGDGRDCEDMHLMAMCKHHIIANSSFSWWGAWLNPSPDKRVIAPQRWFTELALDTRDLIPAAWMQLESAAQTTPRPFFGGTGAQPLVNQEIYVTPDVIDPAVVLNACAVRREDSAVLIAGADRADNSAFAAWFLERGFDHLSDSRVMIEADGSSIVAAAGSATLGLVDPASVTELNAVGDMDDPGKSKARCGLMIFPQLIIGAALAIQPVSAGAAAQQLMQVVANGRNVAKGGLPSIAGMVRHAPAFLVQYSEASQLDGVLDRLSKLILDSRLDPEDAHDIFSAFAKDAAIFPAPTMAPKRFPVPSPTERRKPVKLTVGMATYDDFDGVYFSVQALRLYHPEVVNEIELLVIDNHPDGPCSESLKNLDNWIPNYRYVPELLRTGTSQSRNLVFEQAAGEFVMCMDCHVFVVPGAMRRLLDYFNAQPQSSDLIQGPLIMDDFTNIMTHFKPTWGAGMHGQWDFDKRGEDPNGPPFDIPMQGLGLFACRREAWPGFNLAFRGFGGEEGYIHEKFRQRGDRALCLPFLRWLHRFPRPMGIPYQISWASRIRNYLIGYRELGLPSTDMEAHFRELLGVDTVESILADLKKELNS